MKTYRVVAMYQDAEIAEGFGSSKQAAVRDAQEQICSMYPREEIRFLVYVERM